MPQIDGNLQNGARTGAWKCRGANHRPLSRLGTPQIVKNRTGSKVLLMDGGVVGLLGDGPDANDRGIYSSSTVAAGIGQAISQFTQDNCIAQ
jgi:hypothetical protein